MVDDSLIIGVCLPNLNNSISIQDLQSCGILHEVCVNIAKIVKQLRETLKRDRQFKISPQRSPISPNRILNHFNPSPICLSKHLIAKSNINNAALQSAIAVEHSKQATFFAKNSSSFQPHNWTQGFRL